MSKLSMHRDNNYRHFAPTDTFQNQMAPALSSGNKIKTAFQNPDKLFPGIAFRHTGYIAASKTVRSGFPL